jgi:hypothetical protein
MERTRTGFRFLRVVRESADAVEYALDLVTIDLSRGRTMRRRMDLQSAAEYTARAVLWRLRSCGFAMFGVLAACTDPTAVGPEPDFITLTDIRSMALGSLSGADLLPADRCPSIAAYSSTQTRRRLAGTSATVIVPNELAFQSVGFGGEPGVLLSIADAGLIAIAYDDRVATRSSRYEPYGRFEETTTAFYPQWCAVVIGGRQAQLHVIPSNIARSTPSAVGDSFFNDMVITTSNPDGRAVNIRLLPRDRQSLVGSSSGFDRLLRIIGSLQW